MKKKKGKGLKIFLITALILTFVMFLLNIFVEPNLQDEDYEYETASQEWENHRTILNNDLSILESYLEEYQDVKTTSDISYINAKIAPRLDIFDLHLVEARNFLNSYGYLFDNDFELRSQIDEKIVASQTLRNNINVLVEEYNRQVEAYNQQVDSLIRTFSFLI